MTILDILKAFTGAIIGICILYCMMIVLVQIDILLNFQRGKDMKDWFNTLSNKEIKTWVKSMSNLYLLLTDEEKQNINIAKQILKERAKQ